LLSKIKKRPGPIEIRQGPIRLEIDFEVVDMYYDDITLEYYLLSFTKEGEFITSRTYNTNGDVTFRNIYINFMKFTKQYLSDNVDKFNKVDEIILNFLTNTTTDTWIKTRIISSIMSSNKMVAIGNNKEEIEIYEFITNNLHDGLYNKQK